MSNIIDIIKEEIIDRSNKFENLTRGTKEEYNLYNEHIQYVYKYVLILSKDKDVDKEVVEIAALLHDVSMTDINLDRARHNEYGSTMAEEILTKYNYPKDKIELVKKCILNHSSKRKEFRTTLEESILVDADGLSHFDSIDSLYSFATKVRELDDNEALLFLKDKLTKDYSELSKDILYLVQDKYDRVMNATNISDILDLVNKEQKKEK